MKIEATAKPEPRNFLVISFIVFICVHCFLERDSFHVPSLDTLWGRADPLPFFGKSSPFFAPVRRGRREGFRKEFAEALSAYGEVTYSTIATRAESFPRLAGDWNRGVLGRRSAGQPPFIRFWLWRLRQAPSMTEVLAARKHKGCRKDNSG
jgi:hypothetical protein